ncbi:DNA-binding CsgD family transcriptional regulator [Microbacterium resistens]|uniref:DNA-binding CsgD family transcriptional regulator n=1 Tax=Microbacterium resistens TaxID=156977 RepID=A0ABU1SEH9_9MICO|nr:helix-turn-helix transcriptional regulator [Microbacterium resistens]MDR6867979.1 DNA-binding CsgD family transcriptional regulator [Microbacterium resistens]
MPWKLTTTLVQMREAASSPVAPHVAAQVGAFADGDPGIVREVTTALTPAQLRGGSALPDPLPFPSSVRTEELDGLRVAERRVLLFAALTRTAAISDLLDAAAVDIDLLLFGRIRQLLTIDRQRVRFADDRIRAQILLESSEPERRAVHEALARSIRRRGENPAAAWHTVGADPARRAESAPLLLAHAEQRMVAADPWTAQLVARTAAEGSGDAASRAWATAGVAAVWSGTFDDAQTWLQRGAKGSVAPSAEIVRDLLRVHELLTVGSASGGPYDAEEAGFVFRTLRSAARGPADREAMRHLGAVYTAAYRDLGAADILHARMLLTLSGRSSEESPRLSPHAEAHVVVSQATALVLAGELDGAARLLASAVPRLPLIHPGGGLVASYVRLCAGRSGLDGVIASAFEEIGPATPLRHGNGLSSLTLPPAATARAAAAATMIAPATDSAAAGTTPREPLSARQSEVLDQMLRGVSNRIIADALGVSHRTIEVHVGHVLRKYGVTSRSALLALLSGGDALGG